MKFLRSKHVEILSFILFIGSFLRLYQLNTESLWIDEMNSLYSAERLGFENPRPIYFLILQLWTIVSESDSWLRSISVICGIGSLVLTYHLAKQLTDRNIALVSTLLLAVSPIVINHSQEARMYSLVIFLSLLGTVALVEFFDRPSRKWLVLWSLSRLLNVLTFQLTILLLLPDIVIFLFCFKPWRKWLRAFISALALLVLGLLPTVAISYLPSIQGYLEPRTSGGGEASASASASVSLISTIADSVTSVVSKLVSLTVFWPLNLVLGNSILSLFYKAFALVIFLLLVFAIFKRNAIGRTNLILIWTFLPSITLFLGSTLFLGGEIWISRYLLFIVPYFLIAIAVGFSQLWRWQPQFTVALVLLYSLAVGGGLTYYYSTLYRDDWQGLARVLQENVTPSDTVVYFAPEKYVEYSLPRYYDASPPLYAVSNVENEFADEPLPGDFTEDLPTDGSKLYLACYISCRDEEGVNSIAQKVIGKNFAIEAEQSFQGKSPGTVWPLRLLTIAPGEAKQPE